MGSVNAEGKGEWWRNRVFGGGGEEVGREVSLKKKVLIIIGGADEEAVKANNNGGGGGGKWRCSTIRENSGKEKVEIKRKDKEGNSQLPNE